MNATIVLWSPGLPEILIILLVVIILFGGKKIPELMKGLGLGMKEFKKASKEDDSQNADSKNEIDK